MFGQLEKIKGPHGMECCYAEGAYRFFCNMLIVYSAIKKVFVAFSDVGHYGKKEPYWKETSVKFVKFVVVASLLLS